MEKLTLKQAIVLDFIRKFIDKNGYSPTIREICKGLNLSSTSTVFVHLQKLKEKDCITYEKYKPRTIKIL